MIPLQQINKEWTLFLDRDGVINHEKHLQYVNNWSEFKFHDGVTMAMKIFAGIFNRIIVVTNQRGVSKGLTREEDLHQIHRNMQREIKREGGRIDAIYYCTDINDDSPNRKPNPGMGLQAIEKFPEIDPAKAIMIGNSISDMEFGRNLGTYTLFLPTTRPEVDLRDKRIDMVQDSLFAFSQILANRNE